MWDISSPGRDQTRFCCTGRQILNHWTIREVPAGRFFTVEPPGKPLPSAFHQNAIQPEFKIFILLRIVSAKLFCLEDDFAIHHQFHAPGRVATPPDFQKLSQRPPSFPHLKHLLLWGSSVPVLSSWPFPSLLSISIPLFHWNFEIESYRLCPLFELQYPCLENSMDIGAWQLQSVGLWRVGHDWACTLILHL